LRTQTLKTERLLSNTLSEHAWSTTTVVGFELAAEAVEAGRAVALVAVDTIVACAVVEARRADALVYVGLADLAREASLTLTYVAELVRALDACAAVLAQSVRANVEFDLAATALDHKKKKVIY
jgi:hypothetical protein